MTKIIMNTSPILPISVQLNEATYPRINEIVHILTKLGGKVYSINAMEAAERASSSRSLNIVMLGAYMALEEPILNLDTIKEAMTTSLPSRYLEQNTKALKMGMEKMKELILGV